LGQQAEQNVEKLVIRRLGRLLDVRRFVATWVLLIVLLCAALVGQFRQLNRTFQSMQPVAGGTHSEGMLGTFTNANPLYAATLADTSVSRLVFSGLLTYDSSNDLIGDMAESWSVSEDNKVYTVVLRDGLKWHDNTPLTADDVVFTFRTAQNPDAKSPLFRSWNRIDITAKDARTVVFTLPSAFAPFPHSLTTGIIPKHILENTAVDDLRSAKFNTSQPVGSGPFTWGSVELVQSGEGEGEQRIGLRSYDSYHEGKPQLDRFVVRTYLNKTRLLNDFRDSTINAMVGVDDIPADITTSESFISYNPTLTAQTMAFFKTDSDILKDKTVRQALVRAVNVPQLVIDFSEPVVGANSPLLKGQLGYDASITQLGHNQTKAQELLDKANWKAAAGQTRSKAGKPLSLRLVAQKTADSNDITAKLQQAWAAVGVEATVVLIEENEIQATLRDRNYDILVYGISVGADPDVFPYWHSTQSDPRSGSRLNFSHYNSTTADSALEAGRSRQDSQLRSAKYKPFLQAWRDDAPALALYQPRFSYVTNTPVFGFDQQALNTGSDRFNSVHTWQIQQAMRPKP
jgi:peptide/nickel transport system substrate-binding protein